MTAVTHLTRFQWNATSTSFFHSWLTLAPSCLNTLSFPEYHENMWESLRKYLSQADTASHFCSIFSLWISADLMARKTVTLYWDFLKELLTTFKTSCLLVSVGKYKQSQLRSINEIRSVTVSNACLWIKMSNSYFPFKANWIP